MFLKPGSLICALGVAALMLTTNTAGAQFFPFFQQQPQRPPQPAPQPQPQPQARPAEKTQPAPAKKTPPPAQKAQAVAPKSGPAPKAAPATAAAPYGEVRTACATEIKGTCAGVVPGSAESVQCLRPNFSVLTPQCQAAVQRAGDAMVQPAAAPAVKSDTPAGTSTAPRVVSTDRITQPEGAKESAAPDLKLPAMRPTQEARWVNRNCKQDHSLLCQGVTFGQSRVLRCLLNHHSSLTKPCQTALAKR